VTDSAADIATEQVPVPLHPPALHPVNTNPVLAVAVNTTVLPDAKLNWQAPIGQLIPDGLLTTLPPTVNGPLLEVTFSGKFTPEKLALTLCAPFIVTTHAPAPAQGPFQLINVFPESGFSDSVTTVPAGKFALQVPLEQLIPLGLLVTVPTPVTVIDNLYSVAKLAFAEVEPLIIKVQVLDSGVPAQGPLQLRNELPGAGVAKRLTVVPVGNGAEHGEELQFIPAG
jgi:hypothetical protein